MSITMLAAAGLILKGYAAARRHRLDAERLDRRLAELRGRAWATTS